ncbi:MAG: hypothetical protein LBN23_06530 [Paludibacter sp.]|jgi:hypothetical protein|nr:hypothetical protein [Paludibacter sp.]
MNTQEIIQLWQTENLKLSNSSAGFKAGGKQLGAGCLILFAIALIYSCLMSIFSGEKGAILLGLLLLAVGIFLIIKGVRLYKNAKNGLINVVNRPKSKDEERRAIIYYFEPELKMIQNQITGQANQAGGVVKGTFGATGAILKAIPIPGMGLAGSAVSGIGKLAAQGVDAANRELARRSLMNQKRYITDTLFDEIVNKRVTNEEVLKEKGLDELGLDNSQLTELPPICLKNYWIDEDDEFPLVATGQDEIDRTTTQQTTWLYFTPKQLCACDYYTDIITEKVQKETTEFFWRDVIGISNISKQLKSGIEKKYLVIKDASGDSYSCIYNDEDPKTNSAIRGLKNYFREIKENN